MAGRIISRIRSRRAARQASKKTTTSSPRLIQGPVQQGTSASTFRATGTSVSSSSGGSSTGGGSTGGGSSVRIGIPVKELYTSTEINTIARENNLSGNEVRRGRFISRNGVESIELPNKIRYEPLPNTVSAVDKPKNFLDRRRLDVKDRIGIIETEKSRASTDNKFKVKRQGSLIGLQVVDSLLGDAQMVKDFPKIVKAIYKNPSVIKQIPKSIKTSGSDFGKLLYASPERAFVMVGNEIFLAKVTTKGLSLVGKVGGKALTILRPSFKSIKGGSIILKTAKGGKVTITKAGKIGSKSLKGESIAKQLGLQGKKVTAVSAQADRIISFLKRKRIVRKPIPGEDTFSPFAKKLLGKFDSGKIKRAEFLKLEAYLRRKKKASLLERSFFADPRGRFRPSRLGTNPKKASFLDYVAGDFTLKKGKPQILVFAKTKVSSFPKNKIFKSITNKLKNKGTLNAKESEALLKWQTKKSGKFKPLGFQSAESEITLAAGEIIKRGKKLATTLVNGKRVSIVEASVVKPTKQTAKLLKKSRAGKISKAESNKLNKLLKKETGFKVSSNDRIGKPVLKVPKRFPSGRVSSRKVSRKVSTRKSSPKRVVKIRRGGSNKTPTRRTITPRRPVRRGGSNKTPTRRTTTPPRRVVRRGGSSTRPVKRVSKPPIKPPVRIKLKKKRKSSTLNKKVKPYNVFVKEKGKFLKANRKPLSKRNALNRGAYVTDLSTAATFKVKAVGKNIKKLGKIRVAEKNAFNRISKRSYRIVKGKKVPLKDKYIERRGKPRINTKTEVKKLRASKLIKQLQSRKITKKRRNKK